MALVIGLLVPWALVALGGLRRDPETRPRFYLAPGLFALLGTVAVLTTDPGKTPDFWVGISAGLAGIAAAALVLVVQSFMPLGWWARHSGGDYETAERSAAPNSGVEKP